MRSGLRRRNLAPDREAILSDPNLMQDLRRGRAFRPDRSFETVDDMREAWELVRDDVLPAFIRKYPGRRPFAWWIFDHGKERPLSRKFMKEIGITEEMLRFDKPKNREARFGFVHTRMFNPATGLHLQEPEEEYLDRHGLLEPGELERCVNAFKRDLLGRDV